MSPRGECLLSWKCPSGTIPWSVNYTRVCACVSSSAVVPWHCQCKCGVCFPEQLKTQEFTSKYTFGSAVQAEVPHPQGLCSAGSAAPPAPPAITCCGNVGVPVTANGSALVEMEAKFLGSNARICAFTGRHKGLSFFYSSRNKRLVVVVAFVC